MIAGEIGADGRRLIIATRDLRRADGHLGTFSKWDTGKAVYDVLERPKPGLIPDHPCVPPTDRGYEMDLTNWHPHHSPCFEVKVPGRTAILVHKANWYQELLGCFAPGEKVEEVVDLEGKWLGSPGAKQIGVSASKPALDALMKDLDGKPCRLVIREILPVASAA